jgi:hypothetical protein
VFPQDQSANEVKIFTIRAKSICEHGIRQKGQISQGLAKKSKPNLIPHLYLVFITELRTEYYLIWHDSARSWHFIFALIEISFSQLSTATTV